MRSFRRYGVTDEDGVDLGECRVYLVSAPGRCPRLVVVTIESGETRSYRMHREDAKRGPWDVRVKREERVGVLRFRPPAGELQKARSGYARGM